MEAPIRPHAVSGGKPPHAPSKLRLAHWPVGTLHPALYTLHWPDGTLPSLICCTLPTIQTDYNYCFKHTNNPKREMSGKTGNGWENQISLAKKLKGRQGASPPHAPQQAPTGRPAHTHRHTLAARHTLTGTPALTTTHYRPVNKN